MLDATLLGMSLDRIGSMARGLHACGYEQTVPGIESHLTLNQTKGELEHHSHDVVLESLGLLDWLRAADRS